MRQLGFRTAHVPFTSDFILINFMLSPFYGLEFVYKYICIYIFDGLPHIEGDKKTIKRR